MKQKQYVIFLFALMVGFNVSSQSFQVGHTTITLTDTARGNRSIPTEIYYPADVAGNNVPVSTAVNNKFPVLSFGHGFVMTWDAYQNIWDAVVPEGFIIAFPKTETGFAPSHAEFGKDIAFVFDALAALGQDNASLFYNRIDSMNCVMGHSMGGGSALLAAQFSASVKTLVTFAPAETNPSAIQAAAGLSIPSLIFIGGNDCVTPPPANQIPMYDSLQSSCKTYVSIIGGSHCQMANSNFFCNIGEATCTPQPAITRAEQHLVINRFLLPWLKYELKGDCFAGAQFDSLITTDTNIVFQKTCLLCNTTAINEANSFNNIEIFPNPFKDELFINCKQDVSSKIAIEIHLMNGIKIFSQVFLNVNSNEKLKIALDKNLPAGIYIMKVSDDKQQRIIKVIKQ